MELIRYFPKGFKPNKAQIHILTEISKAINLGKKFIIIEAPTATGKSFIAKTLANYSNDPSKDFEEAVMSYKAFDPAYEFEGCTFGTAILTVTKSLQDQYAAMFEDGSIMKGKSNYPCAVDDLYGCEAGICSFEKNQKKHCISQNKCPYFKARNKTVVNKCAFYSYAMFESLAPESVKSKEFIVCDEASEIESELVSRYTFTFDAKELRSIDKDVPLPPDEDASPVEFFAWIGGCQQFVNIAYEDFIKTIGEKYKKGNKKGLSKENTKRLSLLTRYKENINKLVECWKGTEYIITKDKTSVIFQPYNVDVLAQNIFKYGEIVILMSATIVNHKKFAQNLGIKDYYYIEAETSLDPKKAPIKCCSKFYLNYKNKLTMLPKMIAAADTICKQFVNDKGIIHTHSMDILNEIKKRMGDERFLFREQGMNNEKILEVHENTDEPTVLVSPSMTHGIDLKGDLGKFQIIMKAPYLPLGDKRVRRKFNEDKEWYLDAMLSTLIQMCGRCNRCESDYSVTFILDSNILNAVLQNKDKLPKYFIERFI